MKIWLWLRKVLVVVVGFPLIVLGFIMIPLPGPGLPIIVGGLFVLSLEFEWARRPLAYTRGKMSRVMESVGGHGAKVSGGLRGLWSSWRSR